MLCYKAGRTWVLIRQFVNCMGYAHCECTWVLDILLGGGTPFSRQSFVESGTPSILSCYVCPVTAV
jgi:hypothetical protein